MLIIETQKNKTRCASEHWLEITDFCQHLFCCSTSSKSLFFWLLVGFTDRNLQLVALNAKDRQDCCGKTCVVAIARSYDAMFAFKNFIGLYQLHLDKTHAINDSLRMRFFLCRCNCAVSAQHFG